MIPDNFSAKLGKKYYCSCCDYTCYYISDMDKHNLTRKHQYRTKLNVLEQNIEQNSANLGKPFMCCCGKGYSARNSLWYHKQKCPTTVPSTVPTNSPSISGVNSVISHVAPTNQNITYDGSSTVPPSPTPSISSDLTINSIKNVDIKELVLLLVKENQDVQLQMQKNFLDLIPHIQGVNNSHNTTNIHNTQNFNIQMFLNEHCKNAMNLTDFINTLPITAETYDNTIENGLTKTITNMVVNGLSQLDVLERPIHCTDANRKILYVKEDDVWEKDTELVKIITGIRKLACKQRTMINKWKDMNDGWEKDDNIQTKLTTLICHSMTDIENDTKETGKIIRAIGKNTYLTSDIKNVYI